MDKIEIKVDRMVGCTDGYELYTEKGKTTITFKEMAQYHGDVLPKGDNIQITQNGFGGSGSFSAGKGTYLTSSYFANKRPLSTEAFCFYLYSFGKG